MSVPFDREAENSKLAHIHAEEAEDLASILAEKYTLPYINLSLTPINMDALRIIAETDARAAQAVAYEKNGRHLSVAVRDPGSDAYAALKQRLEDATYIVQEGLASAASITLALARYADLSRAHAEDDGVFGLSAERLATLRALKDAVAVDAHIAALIAQRPAPSPTNILEEVTGAALALHASDVHFEPEEDVVRMRLRLNGLLADAVTFDPRTYHQLNSRIKLLSGLKLNITNRAQDGRFTLNAAGSPIEIRTSIIPGNYGESIVLRILDPEATTHSFRSMGINAPLLKRLDQEIRRPTGMLLTTGPTGSGKTTTLYAFLREIHSPDIKIITLEDPVEYHLPGIVQTQVHAEHHRVQESQYGNHNAPSEETGYTFASGLRSILRQDPDVIMVGEIRDAEVADVAVQAALTGHLVFSTLHTNTAAGAFPRLVDLGVDPKSFSSAITVVMAQRLVRTLNQETKVERVAMSVEQQAIDRVLASLPASVTRPERTDRVWSPPEGDEVTGYSGRTGVHEGIFMDEELGAFLRDNPSAGEIEAHTRRQGFLTIAQDAVLKALAGETSIEEVMRVVDMPR